MPSFTKSAPTVRASAGSFVTVELAQSMEPIDDLQAETPAAYFYLGGESASQSDADGAIVQEVTRTVNVFVVGKHEAMMTLRAELRQLILNYQPDVYHTPLEFVGGDSASIKGEWQWWQDTYTTRTHYRQT